MAGFFSPVPLRAEPRRTCAQPPVRSANRSRTYKLKSGVGYVSIDSCDAAALSDGFQRFTGSSAKPKPVAFTDAITFDADAFKRHSDPDRHAESFGHPESVGIANPDRVPHAQRVAHTESVGSSTGNGKPEPIAVANPGAQVETLIIGRGRASVARVYNLTAMKNLSRILLLLMVAGAIASGVVINSLHASAPASKEDETAVLAPINAMFAAMSKHDPAALKLEVLPGGTMVLMRDGKPTQITFDRFAEIISRPSEAPIQERIHDPLVRVDNDLAVVWAPFEFLVADKVDHCGTDLFNLVKTEGKWLIAAVADTGRKNCTGK